LPQKSVFGNTPTHKQYTVKYCTGVDIEFCILHKRVFDDIQEWSQTYQEPNDDKWMQWQKWLYAGLKAIQPTKEIRKILDISTIAEYIQRVQPYPPFQEKFMLHDTDNNSVIRYSYMGIQGEYEYQTPIMESFQHFTSYFDINIYQMQERLQDFQDKIESCEHTLKNHFEKQQKRLTDLTEANLKQFEDTVNNKFDSIIQKKLANFDEILQQQLEYILIERKREYETQLTEIMDGVLQDLYRAADDGFAALRQAKMTELEDFKASLSEARNATTGATHTPFDPTANTINNRHSTGTLPTVSPGPAKRFTNARVNHNFKPSPNPYDIPSSTASLPSGILRTSNNTASEQHNDAISIPHMVQTSTPLPPVNHDQALKRAKIQFTGLGDIFVFYSQLLNAMGQFGIYLVPLPNVKYQQSLCPTHYRGWEIDEYRKQTMGSTLYQKLQSIEVIPMEYTSIRNIINRFAEDNDGYKVLYAMLELVHPALQRDAVMSPPRSADCDDDIHLYAQKFDAWLRYETYANRPYSTREQVNKFINELSPSFAPAISRVRRLLDAWNPFDVVTPEVLKITALPNTIERFMSEEMGQNTSIVRKIVSNDKHQRSGSNKQHTAKPIQEQSESKDVYCYYCGEYGHPPPTCHFMAKLAKASESLNKIDSKTKKEVIEAFRQKQRLKREKRMKQKTATIRKLLDSGGSKEDIVAVLDTLNTDSDDDLPQPDPSIFIDDDSSTTSSE